MNKSKKGDYNWTKLFQFLAKSKLKNDKKKEEEE